MNLRGINDDPKKIAAGLNKIREAYNAKGHPIPPQKNKYLPAKAKPNTHKKVSPKQTKKTEERFSHDTAATEETKRIGKIKSQGNIEEDVDKLSFYLMEKNFENQEVNQKVDQDMRNMVEIMRKTLKESDGEELEEIKEEEFISQQTPSHLILPETPIQETVRNKEEPKMLDSVYVIWKVNCSK